MSSDDNFTKAIIFIRKWRTLSDDQKNEAVINLIKTLNPSLLISLINEIEQMVKKIGF